MKTISPLGATHQGTQYEYQLFPENFFTGCDTAIYFGDVWVSDIISMEFALQEAVKPIYGYASSTFDAVARGARIVKGSFSIAFRSSGYLNSVMRHIGRGLIEGSADPDLAWQMSGQDKPEWIAGIQDRIEDALDESSTYTTKAVQELNWPVMGILQNTAAPEVAELQKILKKKGYSISPRNYSWPILKHRDRNKYVRELQERLVEFACFDGKPFGVSGVKPDGNFGPITVAGVKKFQTMRKLPVTGEVDATTRAQMEAKVINGQFTTNTMGLVAQFQKDNDIAITGIVDAATRYALSPIVDQKVPGATPSQHDFASYEQEIWGRNMSKDADHKHYPYFYFDRENPEWQVPLLDKGFDIYITYGAIQEKIVAEGLQDFFDINHTVKAIRNVQLTGVRQILEPSGKPVEEIYEFIAKDLD